MHRAIATTLTIIALPLLGACSEEPGGAAAPVANAPVTAPAPAAVETPAPVMPADEPPAADGDHTVLGHWVIYRFFGAKGLGPAPVVEILPDGYMHIDDEFNNNVLTLRYRITDDGSFAAGGPEALFRDRGEREGSWTLEMKDVEMILRRGAKEIAMTRNHPKVRDRNVGYAFTESDQRLRAEMQERMRNFGVAVVRHAAQNDGRLPESLMEVWAAGFIGDGDPSLLESPLGPVDDGGMDYWLAPATRERTDGPPRTGLRDSAYPTKEVLLYDRASYLSPRGVHVVFFDGHVELMSRESFRALGKHRANAGVDFELPAIDGG